MRHLLSIIFLLINGAISAQQFNYSLLDFTHHRINPATVGLYNQWYASLVHREQNNGADFKIRSTALSAAYPQLYPRRGDIRGALGIDFMNDISGLNNSFKVREVGLTYALRIVKEELQSFNLGMSLFYQNRGFDFSSITTNSQYVNGRGFDLSIQNGENLIDFSQNFYRMNAGIYWQKSTLRKQRSVHLGLSVFDLNQARDSFYGSEAFFNSTYFLTAGLMVYADRDIHIYPEVLLVNQNGVGLYNVGLQATYTLDKNHTISFNPRYLIGREIVSVLEFKKGNMVFGVSYDIPFQSLNAANRGSLEFGIKILGDVRPKRAKVRRRRSNIPTEEVFREVSEIPKWDKKPYQHLEIPTYLVQIDLDRNRPSTQGTGSIALEYTFYYATNRSNLNLSVVEDLRDLINSLAPNEPYIIQIEGHTDSTGPEELNQRLSLQRAFSVADFLQSQGLDRSKMKVSGLGENFPVANNDEKLGRALNRRVELRLLRLR